MMNTKLNWGVSSRFIGSRAAEYAARQRGKRERSQMHDFFACEQSRFFRGYIPREARLLDFGCGMGRLLKVLPGREKVGFDVNESALRQCRKAGLRCVGAAELLPKDHFDVALSNHCLEHVPRPLDALKWLSAVMRPGGRLCIMLPLDDW